MWDDFTEYILSLAGEQNVKIVEVGVGKFDKIAETLSERKNITLIKTDINPKDSSVIKDDITQPDIGIYEDADIIYSVRPPSELQPYIIRLAKRTGSQLVIKPLTNEDLNTPGVPMKLKNYKRASFYVLK